MPGEAVSVVLWFASATRAHREAQNLGATSFLRAQRGLGGKLHRLGTRLALALSIFLGPMETILRSLLPVCLCWPRQALWLAAPSTMLSQAASGSCSRRGWESTVPSNLCVQESRPEVEICSSVTGEQRIETSWGISCIL